MRIKKFRLITCLTLFVAAAVAFALALAALPRSSASGADYAPSSVFENGEGGTVGTDRPSEGADSEKTYWMQFLLDNGGKVHFRRNLALKWYTAAKPAADGEPESPASGMNIPGVEKYFGMEFSFPEIAFETFTVSFDSAEENVTKKGVTTNSLVFTATEGGFDAEVRDSFYDEDDTGAEAPQKTSFTYTDGDRIAVRIDETECEPGQFSVYVKVGEEEEQPVGKFTNISGYYLEYRSVDSTTPAEPITFQADLPATAEETAQQAVLMHALNGQTFEVNDQGQIADNAPAVLVLNEKIYPIRLGQQFTLSYTVIDVMRSASVSSRNYYMPDSTFHKPNETASDDEAEKKYNYKSLPSTAYFLPPDDSSEEETAYVSIRFTLTDSTTTDTQVYLTWYADESAVETMGEGENVYDYITILPEIEGPHFAGIIADEVSKTNPVDPDASDVFATVTENYQRELDEAASKMSAGDGAYLYLPSLRELITSDYADYRNLRFNVYYYKPNTAEGSTATSATSLRYSNLRIEVDREGVYKMRVIATDSASNEMKYYDKDGNLVALSSSNVWDIEGLPEFTFEIKYDGPSIEEAGKQDEGRRDQTYSISDFEIIALEGYETDYTLYYLEQSRLPEDFAFPATYPLLASELKTVLNWEKTEGVTGILDLDAAKGENEPKILREIKKYNADVTEDDEEWDDTDNAYSWNPDSTLSFCPQETGYYFVRVLVTDSKIKGEPTESWMAIVVRTPLDRSPGRSKWLQNNTTAIILFAVAAVLLIAIVLVIVIKPSDKKLEEVDLKALKGKRNKKE